MRSEKYIKENLNEALSQNAPDILANILQTERVKDNLENDLRDEPLFLDEINSRRKWIPAGIFTCMVALVLLVTTMIVPKLNNTSTQMLCTITIDVNPSLNIQMDENGNVTGIIANNNDGKKIAEKVNKKIKEDSSRESIFNYITSELEEEGYLDKDSSVMLVSADKKDEGSKKGLKNVKKVISDYKKDNEKKFVTVYQEYDNTDKVKALAKEKKISNAKAAYCLKASEKTNKKIDDICEESLYEVTNELMGAQVDLGDEIEIEEDEAAEEDTSESEEDKDDDEEKESTQDEIEETTEMETMEEEISGEGTGLSGEVLNENPEVDVEETTEAYTDSEKISETAVPKEKKLEVEETAGKE